MTTPVTVHVLDWQTALAELPGLAAGVARDQAIAHWAEQCWKDLCTALPGQQHAVLATPGNVEESTRLYLVSPQATGWLYSPLTHPPHWRPQAASVMADAARDAAARGFCAADAALLGMMAALASLDQSSSTVPQDFSRHRRYFPLLGEPRSAAFSPMPRTCLQAGHPHALYAVMGDSDWVIRCMELGVRLVQLRLKKPSPGELDAQIARCADAAARHGALLIINDHWQAALQHVLYRNGHGIFGVHMGQEDLQAMSDADLDRLLLSGLRLGLSTHSLWELSRALRTRPSHVACGPVHATTTKDMPWIPLGNTNVGWWAQLVHGEVDAQHPPLPLVAIGGMQPARAEAAAAAGADMVAVVSDITSASEPGTAVPALREAFLRGQRQRPPSTPPAWPEPTLKPQPCIPVY